MPYILGCIASLVVLVVFCVKNSRSARLHARSGGWAVGYTVLLWLGGGVLAFAVPFAAQLAGLVGIVRENRDRAFFAFFILLLYYSVAGSIGGIIGAHCIARRGRPWAGYPGQNAPPH